MSHGIAVIASAMVQSANNSNIQWELQAVEHKDAVEIHNQKWYSQEFLQKKNIHKYKIQMVYFTNYTGTPTYLLVQFLQIFLN